MSQYGQYISLAGGLMVHTLTGDAGGTIHPVAGNINLLGGANIATVGTPGTITFNLDGTTDHAIQLGNAGGSISSLAVGASGTLLTGVTGADPAFSATPTCTDLTLTGVLKLPSTTATVGQIKINNVMWTHAYGTDNTFVGASAGNITLTVANAANNTAIGFEALKSLVGTNASEGSNNTAGGFRSLGNLTEGMENSAWGVDSGLSVTTGNANCFFGEGSGTSSITTGSYNVFLGYATGGDYASDESSNILIGSQILGITGEDNTLRIGKGAGTNPGEISKVYIANAYSNYGTENTFVGASAGNTTLTIANAVSNTAIGFEALKSVVGTAVTEASGNSAGGTSSLSSATQGSYNSAWGADSGLSVTTGNYNIFFGYISGETSVTSGSYNTFLGSNTGNNYTANESSNILIGYGNTGTLGESNVLRIGKSTGTHIGDLDASYIAGIYGKTTGTTCGVMLVDNADKLGVVSGAGTAGQVLTSGGAGAIPTWQDAAAGFVWSIKTEDLNPMVVDNGYIANKAGLLTFTLPTTCAVGKVLRVSGMNTDVGWRIAQNANQIIHFGTLTTTTGVGGYLESTKMHDSVELVCIVEDLEFLKVSSDGNITVV